MAVWMIWHPTQEQAFKEWVATRPTCIQEMVEKYGIQPNKLYRLKTTDQRVVVTSLNENNTVQVAVPGEFNRGRLFVDHGVFGIDPADLEECELPEGVVVIQGDEVTTED